jgi:hypothetical protein
MIGHQMPTAFLAELAVAGFSFLEMSEMLLAPDDFYILRLPQRKRVDRARGPGSARFAMAIAHSFRRPLNLNLDGSAKTFTLMCSHDEISGYEILAVVVLFV